MSDTPSATAELKLPKDLAAEKGMVNVQIDGVWHQFPKGTRQEEHNLTHGITPQGVKRALQQSLHTHEKELEQAENLNRSMVADDVETYDKLRVIAEMEEEMREASSRLEFERAAHLRDQIAALKNPAALPERKPVRYPTGKGGGKKRLPS